MQAAQETPISISTIRPIRRPAKKEGGMEVIEENIDHLLAALVATRQHKLNLDQAKLMRGLRGVADLWLGNHGECVEQSSEVWGQHMQDMWCAMMAARPLGQGFVIPD